MNLPGIDFAIRRVKRSVSTDAGMELKLCFSQQLIDSLNLSLNIILKPLGRFA